ncbi:MAG: hypothetical protein ACTHNU_18120 [Gaiellales bacterium]
MTISLNWEQQVRRTPTLADRGDGMHDASRNRLGSTARPDARCPVTQRGYRRVDWQVDRHGSRSRDARRGAVRRRERPVVT